MLYEIYFKKHYYFSIINEDIFALMSQIGHPLLLPGIVFSPCTAHCLDLLLEDIGRLQWAAEIIK